MEYDTICVGVYLYGRILVYVYIFWHGSIDKWGVGSEIVVVPREAWEEQLYLFG